MTTSATDHMEENVIDNLLNISRRTLIAAGGLGLLGAAIGMRPSFAITADDIKKRGKLLVGVQADNPP